MSFNSSSPVLRSWDFFLMLLVVLANRLHRVLSWGYLKGLLERVILIGAKASFLLVPQIIISVVVVIVVPIDHVVAVVIAGAIV
jgi:hypothetical protein